MSLLGFILTAALSSRKWKSENIDTELRSVGVSSKRNLFQAWKLTCGLKGQAAAFIRLRPIGLMKEKDTCNIYTGISNCPQGNSGKCTKSYL